MHVIKEGIKDEILCCVASTNSLWLDRCTDVISFNHIILSLWLSHLEQITSVIPFEDLAPNVLLSKYTDLKLGKAKFVFKINLRIPLPRH